MYLDANFFLFANFDSGEKGKAARKILSDIQDGKEAVTSALALDEVMWVLLRNKQKEFLRPVIEDIYQVRNLSVKGVSGGIPLKALKIMEAHHLKPRDAFHVAVMQELGETVIVTDDADFDKLPGVKRKGF